LENTPPPPGGDQSLSSGGNKYEKGKRKKGEFVKEKGKGGIIRNKGKRKRENRKLKGKKMLDRKE
jgi:hypothetical protein